MAPDRRPHRPQPARRRGPGPRARSGERRAGVPSGRDRQGREGGAGLSRHAAEVIGLLEEAGAALDRDRAADAVRHAARAKALAARSATVREVLGLALYRGGQFREAIRELQAYRRMTGRADQNHLLADSFRAVGQPDRALPLAEEAIRARVPDEIRAEAAVVAGAALGDLGRFDESLALLRRFDRGASGAAPHDLRIWYVMADVLERAGRRREAADRFRRILDHDPDAYDVAERLAALS